MTKLLSAAVICLTPISSAIGSVSPPASPVTIFADPFTDLRGALSHWTPTFDAPFVTWGVRDYDRLGVSEAPTSDLLGGPPTTGVYFEANRNGGSPAALELQSHSHYNLPAFELQFDVFLSTGPGALFDNNATETIVWGVGRTTNEPLSYAKRTSHGDGVWGWLATDNGFLQEDVALYEGIEVLVDLGETVDAEAPDLFNAAFGPDPGIPNHAPLNDWVTVKTAYDGRTVEVSFNDVLFFQERVNAIAGGISIGYADPFASISSSPDLQWGLVDNVILRETTPVPEPLAALLLLVGLSGLSMLGAQRMAGPRA